MSREERLQSEIKTLTAKIKKGVYTGEQYQIAMDMLKTKRDELRALSTPKGTVEAVKNPPIVGMTKPAKKTSTKMAGGFKSCI